MSMYSQANQKPKGNEMSEDRLTRIETKLDQLADAMISMARMEEKMITLFKRMDKYDENQGKLDERLHNIERAYTKTGVFGYIADKLIWIVLGVGLTFAVKKFGG